MEYPAPDTLVGALADAYHRHASAGTAETVARVGDHPHGWGGQMIGRRVRGNGGSGVVVRWDPCGEGMCDALVRTAEGSVWHASHTLQADDGLGPLPSRAAARERARIRARAALATIRAQHVRDFSRNRWPGAEHGKAIIGRAIDAALAELGDD